MRIKFCGAAEGVTGSCHLLTTDKHSVLLDCGMYQGGKDADIKNRSPFPFDPKTIECAVISHAHIDHVGRLPLLVKQGFRGPIYATDATADLIGVMLRDSAHIHEADALSKTKKNQRAGKPEAIPLYTTEDAEKAIKLVVPKRCDQLFEINDEMKIVFNEAGHILGSAIIEVFADENGRQTKLVFSGDLGMMDRPILKDPKTIHKADALVMETTYGNRVHQDSNLESIETLLDIAVKTAKRGGAVVIPAFAVGRTQELIYQLNKVYDGKGPMHDALVNVPVYVDSPMCVEATKVFCDNAQAYDEETREFLLNGDHPLDFKNLRYTAGAAASRAINDVKGPKIIIAASGMCDAGRIRHHLKHCLWDKRNSIIFVGYQAQGTLGRRLIEGAKTVSIFGEPISVAAEIYNLEGFSGHADRNGLYDWYMGFEKEPGATFLVHGEPDAKDDFAKYVYEHSGRRCTVVTGYDEYELPAHGEHADYEEKNALFSETDFTENLTPEEIMAMLGEIQAALENITENSAIDNDSELSAAKLAELKNIIANLEGDVLKLGGALSKEDRKPEEEQ